MSQKQISGDHRVFPGIPTPTSKSLWGVLSSFTTPMTTPCGGWLPLKTYPEMPGDPRKPACRPPLGCIARAAPSHVRQKGGAHSVSTLESHPFDPQSSGGASYAIDSA